MATYHPDNPIANLTFRREIERLHLLGPRVLAELIVDLDRRLGPPVRERTTVFAALDPEVLALLGAMEWPPSPLYLVPVAA